ncbi:PREDICTED: uncharacterized protein LOC108759028 [Trachymyrmex cornetzi]|uniref:DUF4776 domain-containing protein n=1 Tax=Trachymyrmex cornetzi TaxID=471704 RepID=A0A151JC81_9HYME|nr:PREDICTED: uncharacterized protein LOC108759028 [Trachymyrmex cornetzi]XP_018359786.1 PREDICTED: uncharacterized protein LOC108759028 [Trachymyrmex cornetzi]XP_018359787.1 PREDICTED: uncharacterized protein LOC108759028 [Trachymyrmex cornetzi]KYN22565.1 hypothetical protein ALC57_05021 [Trachymyrmex cornetzi]
MALKKNMSIFEGEQLYMLEILIDHLNLCPEKTVSNEGCDLMIRIGFVDFKPIDIIAQESLKVNDGRTRSKANGFSNEYINCEGKTCLLVRTPSNLIRSVKSTPLSIEVYRISLEEDHNSRDDARFVLFCAATAFLPRSFCDHITAAKNKIDGLSKSYVLTKIYTLTDEHGYPCGSISMCMRLSCFGSSIINHLVLREKSFILRGFPLGWELSCTKLSDESENNERYMKKCDNNTSLLHKILDPTYSKLYNQDDRTETEPVLTRPESPPRISMNQPGFEKLTSAEKLNDHKYRGLIYEIYHDEPTCSCLPTDRSTHPMMCRSGCVRSCCMALRNPDSLKKFPSLATLASDNFYLKSDMEQNVTNHDSTRLRGGEDTEDNYLNNKVSWDEGYTWHENDINLKNRMMGGSDYSASARAFPEATTVIYEKSKRTGANLPCKFRSRTVDGIKGTDCICPGKVSSPWKTNASRCSKKPCVGADCMIRAFKEVQEFVDSLGKVPGMKGLGLMDPSESPYFGRDIQWDYTIQETPSERKRGYPISAPPVPTVQCLAPCNTQIGKPIASTLSAPYVASTSIMTVVPGRSGIVREAIPSLPETTSLLVAVKPSKKKEEKLEKQKELDVTTSAPLDVDVGPCGEPKCKSRRKKKNNRTMPRDNEESETKPIQTLPPSTIAAKAVGKLIEKGRYPKGKPGPSGDRDRSRPIKVSRRVMRYVYSIGDVYPGTNYGHKNCIDPRFRVPANMGWLWNTRATAGKFKPRIGWKPGAIGRYLNALLKEAKGASMEDYRARSIPSRTSLRRGKVYKSMSYVSQMKKESEEDAEPPPTLHIHRKDGTYYVTMYPIRQETTADVSQLEEPMKPLQFKIVRNKDDASVASSSTASDMEIEFSPPAAVNRYRKKPDVIHVDTQVRQQEILDAFKLTVDTPKTKEKKDRRERKGKK